MHGRVTSHRASPRRRALLRARRRRTAVVALLTLAAVLVGIDLTRGGGRDAATDLADVDVVEADLKGAPSPSLARPTPSTPAAPAPRPSPARAPGPLPATASGAFGYAAGVGRVLGRAGPLRRYRVAVEEGIGEPVGAVAATVDAVLGDARSWIAGGTLRLQRVPRGAGAEFTVYLATPRTSERMCATGGLQTEGYTSCRLPGQVIINLARWRTAVPGYRAPLREYRAYAINHEVGHELGYGHEACPAAGRPAPVMQQQTLGLRGCVAYGWPYRDGRRYSGPRVS